MSQTNTVENYLKAIFKLSDHGKNAVTTNEIAERMKTKAATVSDMIKKLHTKKLITHERYMGVTMTEHGQKIALEIIRKHRLWEVFLTTTLKFKWDEVHDIAEQLEHIESTELIERLDKFLGFPKYDPHGDPIPDASGKIKTQALTLLSDLMDSQMGTVSGVVNHSPTFLKHLEKNKISIGTHCEIISKNDFDNSMMIKIDRRKKMHISSTVSSNLLIKI